MPVPGPHDDEFTVELDEDTWVSYRKAISHAAAWKAIADALREKLEASLGEATAGILDGKKVLYYRPAEKWAEARIIKDYPELAQHFIRVKEQHVFDIEAFRLAHPGIADKYQVRSFRSAE